MLNAMVPVDGGVAPFEDLHLEAESAELEDDYVGLRLGDSSTSHSSLDPARPRCRTPRPAPRSDTPGLQRAARHEEDRCGTTLRAPTRKPSGQRERQCPPRFYLHVELA